MMGTLRVVSRQAACNYRAPRFTAVKQSKMQGSGFFQLPGKPVTAGCKTALSKSAVPPGTTILRPTYLPTVLFSLTEGRTQAVQPLRTKRAVVSSAENLLRMVGHFGRTRTQTATSWSWTVLGRIMSGRTIPID